MNTITVQVQPQLIESQFALQIPRPPDRNPALVYLASIGSSSRRTMAHALNTIAAILTQHQCDAIALDWSKLRYQHTMAIRSVLKEMYAASTANRMLSAMRKTLYHAWKLELLAAEDYQRATDIPDIKASQDPSGRVIDDGELAALFNVCLSDSSAAGLRDAAMFSIMSAGLRRSEVAVLRLENFVPSTGAVHVKSGKGNKDRTTYLIPNTIEYVIEWLAVRGNQSGPLLYPVNKGGSIIVIDEPLSDQAIKNTLDKRIAEANISKCSPHDFRRTFITNLLKAGVDVITVSKLAGHSDPNTTKRYDLREEDAKLDAVRRLSVSAQRRVA